jgi:hypothetical protein
MSSHGISTTVLLMSGKPKGRPGRPRTAPLDRVSIRLLLTRELVEAIDTKCPPGQRTAWITQAIVERLTREQ